MRWAPLGPFIHNIHILYVLIVSAIGTASWAGRKPTDLRSVPYDESPFADAVAPADVCSLRSDPAAPARENHRKAVPAERWCIERKVVVVENQPIDLPSHSSNSFPRQTRARQFVLNACPVVYCIDYLAKSFVWDDKRFLGAVCCNQRTNKPLHQKGDGSLVLPRQPHSTSDAKKPLLLSPGRGQLGDKSLLEKGDPSALKMTRWIQMKPCSRHRIHRDDRQALKRPLLSERPTKNFGETLRCMMVWSMISWCPMPDLSVRLVGRWETCWCVTQGGPSADHAHCSTHWPTGHHKRLLMQPLKNERSLKLRRPKWRRMTLCKNIDVACKLFSRSSLSILRKLKSMIRQRMLLWPMPKGTHGTIAYRARYCGHLMTRYRMGWRRIHLAHRPVVRHLCHRLRLNQRSWSHRLLCRSRHHKLPPYRTHRGFSSNHPTRLLLNVKLPHSCPAGHLTHRTQFLQDRSHLAVKMLTIRWTGRTFRSTTSRIRSLRLRRPRGSIYRRLRWRVRSRMKSELKLLDSLRNKSQEEARCHDQWHHYPER